MADDESIARLQRALAASRAELKQVRQELHDARHQHDASEPPPQLPADDRDTKIGELQGRLDTLANLNRDLKQRELLTALCERHRAWAPVLLPHLLESTRLEVDEVSGAPCLLVCDPNTGETRLDPRGKPITPDQLVDEFRYLKGPHFSAGCFEPEPLPTGRRH